MKCSLSGCRNHLPCPPWLWNLDENVQIGKILMTLKCICSMFCYFREFVAVFQPVWRGCRLYCYEKSWNWEIEGIWFCYISRHILRGNSPFCPFTYSGWQTGIIVCLFILLYQILWFSVSKAPKFSVWQIQKIIVWKILWFNVW